MIRHYRRSYLYLLCLSLSIGSVTFYQKTAVAQVFTSISVKEKISQLERIYHAHSQLLTQLQQQLSDNQHDIDLLRGQIQENQHQLSQLMERHKKIYQKVDVFSSSCMSVNSNDNQSEVPLKTKNNVLQKNSVDANVEYNKAMTLMLKKKQYDQAIDTFQSFIKRYPDSIYQSNAHYWLGQLYYNKNKKNDALYYFSCVAKKYPQSPKAPDALLKIGILMQEKGQKDKARDIYQQVGKLYPSKIAAKQAQKRLAKL